MLDVDVRLGADDDTGNMVQPAEIKDLLVDDLDHIERISGRNGVDEDVAMHADGML